MDGASRWDRTPPLAPWDSADDSGTALAAKRALGRVGESLKRMQGKHDTKAYRPPEFEGDEDGDELMSL